MVHSNTKILGGDSIQGPTRVLSGSGRFIIDLNAAISVVKRRDRSRVAARFTMPEAEEDSIGFSTMV